MDYVSGGSVVDDAYRSAIVSNVAVSGILLVCDEPSGEVLHKTILMKE